MFRTVHINIFLLIFIAEIFNYKMSNGKDTLILILVIFIFSDEEINIEKKLRVEDLRLLRQRFTRSIADSVNISIKKVDKTHSKKNFSKIYMINN